MHERSANPTPNEPGKAPERFPRWSVALTIALGSLWLFVLFAAPRIAGPVAEVVNDVDLELGIWSRARPDGDDE